MNYLILWILRVFHHLHDKRNKTKHRKNAKYYNKWPPLILLPNAAAIWVTDIAFSYLINSLFLLV